MSVNAFQGLKLLRERAGLTIREIADLIEMPCSTYNSYERKNYRQPHLPMKFVQRLVPGLIGRGNPPITEVDLLALAGSISGAYVLPGAETSIVGPSNVRRADAPSLLELPSRLRDVPLYPTKSHGSGFTLNRADSSIDYAPRPTGLTATSSFAFYAADASMAPWREPGELVYVHHSRAAAVGCHVVVRLEDNENLWLLRKLVSRSASVVVLEQYTPAQTETIAPDQIAEMLRVLEWQEVLGLA
jgi:hypothetical protein